MSDTDPSGFEEARAPWRQDWESIERDSGSTRERCRPSRGCWSSDPNGNFVWSMGLTQHAHGVDNVQALVNVGLGPGLAGPSEPGPDADPGPLGVQGGAEVGCAPGLEPNTARISGAPWGFRCRAGRPWTAAARSRPPRTGDVDVFWIVGGNFLETLPDAAGVAARSRGRRSGFHQDIVLTSIDAGAALGHGGPVPGHDALRVAGRRHRDLDRAAHHLLARDPRAAASARRGRSGRSSARSRRACGRTARRRSASGPRRPSGTRSPRAIPLYAGIETPASQGDQVQWGGARLYADGASRRRTARRTSCGGRPAGASPRRLVLRLDPPRQAVQLDGAARGRPADRRRARRRPDRGRRRERSAAAEGDASASSRDRRRVRGRARIAPIKPGNLEVHWPEGNVLLGTQIDPDSGEPDYNALVRLEKLELFRRL